MLWSGLFTATEASLGAFHLVLGWPLITALVFITIGPAILAYRFWGAGVRRSSPAVGGFFANLIPLFTAILSVLVLGQAPSCTTPVRLSLSSAASWWPHAAEDSPARNSASARA